MRGLAALILAPALILGAPVVAAPGKARGALDADGGIAFRGKLARKAVDHLWWNNWPAEPINDKLIEKVQATCASSCIWFGRPSTGGIVRDAELTRAGPAPQKKIDAGIKIGGSKGNVPVTGILIERVWSHGWQQVPVKGYANGDGLVINRMAGTITVRDSKFDENADGGVDTKADLTILDNVSAARNGHYGFRFWNKAQATTLTAIDNAWGAIEAEAGADVVIDRLVMVGGQELVTAKKGARVVVKSCDLSGWTGTDKVKGGGSITLGAGC